MSNEPSGNDGFDGEETPVSRPHSIAKYPLRRRSMPAMPHTDQWSFTAPFEGVVPHLYLDSRGLVTCGVGFLIGSSLELTTLPWQPNGQIALVDYHTVRRCDPGRGASWYGQFCKAYLTEPAMRGLFDHKIQTIEQALTARWQLQTCPDAVRIALIDMAYNLGVGGLNRFEKLRAAVLAKDWVTAANESHRTGIQDSRNAATKALFESASAPAVT